jgi:leucyl/phenylalanyl-tRNA---protein transferase
VVVVLATAAAAVHAGAVSRFPDPRHAPGDAPLAVGGDLRPETLLDAYGQGIFPWPVADRLVYWWSPDPRGVIPVGGLHVSRSLQRTLRRGRFRHTIDRAFADVVAACADRPGEGTWILPEMADAYGRLHRLGVAHSVEVWDGSALVGGVYGVASGAVFSGESMFHRATDASKVALVRLMEHLGQGGFTLLDTQLHTAHLGSLGAVEMERRAFLDVLAHTPPGRW